MPLAASRSPLSASETARRKSDMRPYGIKKYRRFPEQSRVPRLIGEKRRDARAGNGRAGTGVSAGGRGVSGGRQYHCRSLNADQAAGDGPALVRPRQQSDALAPAEVT